MTLDKEPKSEHRTTTFQISNHLYTQMKTMCLLTRQSMGEFIRLAIADRVKKIKEQPVKEK